MPERQLFLFLEPGSDPTGDTVTIDCDGVETLLAWVPDAAAAARIAGEQAAAGLGIVELYRGFTLDGVAAVTSEVGDRGAVGCAVYPPGVQPPTRINLSATIFQSGPGSQQPIVRRHPGGGSTVVVGAPDPAATVAHARALVDDGVDLVEICGGEPLTTAARVVDAVAGRVPVSYVVYPYDSLERAAAYKQSFFAADQP